MNQIIISIDAWTREFDIAPILSRELEFGIHCFKISAGVRRLLSVTSLLKPIHVNAELLLTRECERDVMDMGASRSQEDALAES